MTRPAMRPRRRRWATVPALAAAGAVGVGSAAWACVPEPADRQTKISRCTPPTGAPKPCKTPVGAPKFPNATFVKGPSGSTIVAYVTGPGMDLTAYDLVFATKPQLESGQACSSATSAVISEDSVVSRTDGGISATVGQIPANSPLGLSQVCFTDVLRTQAQDTTSTPAQFKVTV